MVQNRLRVLMIGALALSFVSAQPARAQHVAPVPAFDLKRFSGTWYELAHLPNRAEKDCVRNAVTLYALGDKPRHFQLVDSCMTKGDYTDWRGQTGRELGKGADGRLKLGWLWPFAKNYWVLASGPDYSWTVIGSPNHKALWILSRTPELSPAQYASLEAKAAAEGFPVDRLIRLPQNP